MCIFKYKKTIPDTKKSYLNINFLYLNKNSYKMQTTSEIVQLFTFSHFIC